MERQKYKIIIFFLFYTFGNIGASSKSDIYTAFVNNNMQSWKNIIDRMDAISPKNDYMLLELVNYQYGYIAWCIGNKKEADAKKYLDLAEKNILILSKDKRNLSLVNSYKVAFYGYKIGLNRLLAPFIWHKCNECARLAIKLDKENPFAWVQYGNIHFYVPSVFGGSKNEALIYYLKAQELMEKDIKDIKENWNYLSLLIVIAQSYSYLNDFQSSITYLEKILEIEPGFGYVKNELYQQALNKMKK